MFCLEVLYHILKYLTGWFEVDMLFYDFLVIQIDGILGHLLEYDVHEKNSVDFLELARGARY